MTPMMPPPEVTATSLPAIGSVSTAATILAFHSHSNLGNERAKEWRKAGALGQRAEQSGTRACGPCCSGSPARPWIRPQQAHQTLVGSLRALGRASRPLRDEALPDEVAEDHRLHKRPPRKVPQAQPRQDLRRCRSIITYEVFTDAEWLRGQKSASSTSAEKRSRAAGQTATVKRPKTAPDAPRLNVDADRRKRLARLEQT